MAEPRTGQFRSYVACITLLASALSWPLATTQAAEPAGVPQFQVDPFWPKPLPNNWLLGQVSGIATDKYDRIWVVHRPASLNSTRARGGTKSAGSEMLCGSPARTAVRSVR